MLLKLLSDTLQSGCNKTINDLNYSTEQLVNALVYALLQEEDVWGRREGCEESSEWYEVSGCFLPD